MGNNAIIIRTVGSHQNGDAVYDSEQIAKRCVNELRAAGHTLLSASVETGGGSIDLINGQVLTTKNPEEPAQAAYDRYLQVTGGLNYEGKPCPTWPELTDKIRAAWMAAVDHTQPRITR